MRIANAVLMPLMALGCVLLNRLDLGDPISMWGALVGIVLATLPFYLAWRGLGPNSTFALIRNTRLANIVAGLFYILFIGFISFLVASVNISLIPVLFIALCMLIMGIPYALNIRALGRRKIELKEMKTQRS